MKRLKFLATAIGTILTLQACNYADDRQVADEEETTARDTEPLEEGEGVFVEWDTDQDQYISLREFGEGLRGREFIIGENTSDEEIDARNWGSMVFTAVDADDDEFWTREEWETYAAQSDEELGEWEDWDVDEDGVIDAEEWRQGVAERQMFEGERRPQSDRERGEFIFNYYDANRDGRLDELEFQSFIQDFGHPRPRGYRDQATEENQQTR